MESFDQAIVNQLPKVSMSDLDIYPIPIVIIDLNNNITAMNQHACKLHQCHDSNPIGLSYSQLCKKKDLPNVLEKALGQLKQASNQRIKEIYIYDQKEQVIEWKVNVLEEKSGSFTGFLLFGKDATWEKMHGNDLDYLASKTKKILGNDCESHSSVSAYVDDIIYHYENIFAQMPGYVYWKDLEGRYLGVNNNIVQAAQMDSREVCIGKTDEFFAKKMGWKDGTAEAFQKNDQMIALTGQKLINKEEHPFTDSQGKKINPLTNKIPLYNRNKQLQGILGITIDITDRNKLIQLEQEKQLLQEDFDNVIENMAGYVYWKDRQGVYIKCNKQVANMLGFTSCDEIRGKTDFDLAKLMKWSKEVPERLVRDDKMVMETGIPLLNQEEEPFTDVEGNLIYQLSTRIPLKNKKGEVIGIIGNTLDITDKKKVEKLEKENEIHERTITQLKALAGGIAHQITNPLAGIKSAFGYIERKFPQLIQAYKKSRKTSNSDPQLSSQQVENIESKITQIKQRIDKTQYIIDHHLMNIKSNYNKLLIDTTSIKEHSITSIIEETLSDFPFIEQQKKLVHWQGGEDFKIYGVKFLLVHVLNNLIDNALDSVHFSNKSDAKITICLEQDKATHVYRVHIKDTGLGLPHSGRTDLFKPFHTKRNNGTGLGLYFCKTVMEAHHGRIIVRGKDGEYAQFTLIFPNPKEFSRYRRRAYKKLLMAQ